MNGLTARCTAARRAIVVSEVQVLHATVCDVPLFAAVEFIDSSVSYFTSPPSSVLRKNPYRPWFGFTLMSKCGRSAPSFCTVGSAFAGLRAALPLAECAPLTQFTNGRPTGIVERMVL